MALRRLVVLILLGIGLPVHGEDRAKAVAEPLMLSESLEHWRHRTTKEGEAVYSPVEAATDGEPGWSVGEGVLHLKPKGRDVHLPTPVGDFELAFEFRVAKGANSGIKYRVATYKNRVLGLEYQLIDDSRTKSPIHSTASLYALYPPAKTKTFHGPDRWNTGKIIVRHPVIEHWLNGEKVVSATVGSDDWRERVQNSKFKGYDGFGENLTGTILIQDHGGEVWLRKMVLTPLPTPTAPTP